MINIRDNVWTHGEGYKYISNGDIFAEVVHLKSTDSISNWHDTNDDPPTPEEEIDDSEALSIITGKEG